MSAGVNYVGGRGRIAPRQSKDVERVSKEHFAKQRFIDYTQTAQGALNTPKSKPIFTMSFKHAPNDYSEHDRTSQRTTTSTTGTQSGAYFGPHVANGPNKPMKQSKLLEMMDSEIRRDESFDASRSRISTMDIKRFAGLDIFPRKRKAGINGLDRPQKRSAFTQGFHNKPRASVSPPAKEPISVQLTQCSENEEMPSSGVSSVNNEVKTSRPPSQVLPVDELNATEVSLAVTDADSQSQTRPVSPTIPPNLWDRAYLLAAQSLGLSDPVLPLEPSPTSQVVPAGSVDCWVALNGCFSSNSAEDDATIYAFNLAAPGLEAAFHGEQAESVATSVTAASPHLSDLVDSNEFEYNSPVIIPTPGHGVPATVDSQDGSIAAGTAPHGECRAPRSDSDNRFGHGALASPPPSHHPTGELPLIQWTPIHSQHIWLRTSNWNAAGTVTSPPIHSPCTPDTRSRTKDQARGTDYRLGFDQEAPRPVEPPQGPTQFTRPSSTNSFALFSDGSDCESDS